MNCVKGCVPPRRNKKHPIKSSGLGQLSVDWHRSLFFVFHVSDKFIRSVKSGSHGVQPDRFLALCYTHTCEGCRFMTSVPEDMWFVLVCVSHHSMTIVASIQTNHADPGGLPLSVLVLWISKLIRSYTPISFQVRSSQI
jgi:hypothetical protein